MRYATPPTHVEFDNPSPDTIEIRVVTSIDLASLVIPPGAVRFQFLTAVPGAPPEAASPLYILGTEFGTPDAMATRYPAFAATIDDWRRHFPVKAIGKFEWDYELDGKRWQGFQLIPLSDDTVLFDPETRRVVWPAA